MCSDFGPVDVGTHATLTVTVTNDGPGALRRGTSARASFLVIPGTFQPAGHDVFFLRETQPLNRG